MVRSIARTPGPVAARRISHQPLRPINWPVGDESEEQNEATAELKITCRRILPVRLGLARSLTGGSEDFVKRAVEASRQAVCRFWEGLQIAAPLDRLDDSHKS